MKDILILIILSMPSLLYGQYDTTHYSTRLEAKTYYFENEDDTVSVIRYNNVASDRIKLGSNMLFTLSEDEESGTIILINKISDDTVTVQHINKKSSKIFIKGRQYLLKHGSYRNWFISYNEENVLHYEIYHGKMLRRIVLKEDINLSYLDAFSFDKSINVFKKQKERVAVLIPLLVITTVLKLFI